MAAWVTAARQVRLIEVPVSDYRRGPVAHVKRLQVTEMREPEIREAVRRAPVVDLPETTGAGPCGSHARLEWVPRMIDPNKLLGPRSQTHDAPPMRNLTPMQWSVVFLLEPMQRYFATYEQPVTRAPKSGPRGRSE